MLDQTSTSTLNALDVLTIAKIVDPAAGWANRSLGDVETKRQERAFAKASVIADLDSPSVEEIATMLAPMAWGSVNTLSDNESRKTHRDYTSERAAKIIALL